MVEISHAPRVSLIQDDKERSSVTCYAPCAKQATRHKCRQSERKKRQLDMKKRFSKKTKLVKKQAWICLVLGLAIILASGTKVALAEWREPDLPPVDEQSRFFAPISTGGENQAKQGYLQLDPTYDPTKESSLMFGQEKPLDVKGEGALFSVPYVYSDVLRVDTDTLYVDSVNDWVGIGVSEFDYDASGDWPYRQRISFNNSAVESTLTNFPVMIHIDSSNFDFWNNTAIQDGRNEVRFTDSDSVTELDFHFESFDHTADDAIAWVEIPELRPDNTNYIYLYYGLSGADSGEDEAGTYDNNYVMVHHLQETDIDDDDDDIKDIKDSTINKNDGATAGSELEKDDQGPGQVDGSIFFHQGIPPEREYVKIENNLTLDTPTVTVEAWVKRETIDEQHHIIYADDSGFADDRLHSLIFNIADDNKLWFWFGNKDGNARAIGWSVGTVADKEWHHVAVVRDHGNKRFAFYIDGDQDNGGWIDYSLGDIYSLGGNDMWIGGVRYYDGTIWHLFNGRMDEVRVSNTARSADWLSTVYRSESDPLFSSWGVQEVGRVTGEKFVVYGGTVLVGTDTASINGVAVSGYGQDGAIAGVGIYGEAGITGTAGVYGLRSAAGGQGVKGESDSNAGVKGESYGGYGIYGVTSDQADAAIYAQNIGSGWAGYFDGRLGAGSDVVANRFLPTHLQKSLIPFTSGQLISTYQSNEWFVYTNQIQSAFDGSNIWVSADFFSDDPYSEIMKFRASDGKQLLGVPTPISNDLGNIASIIYDGTNIWASDLAGHITKRDGVTGERIGPRYDVGTDRDRIRSIIVSTENGKKYIWAVLNSWDGNENDRIVKIDADDPNTREYISLWNGAEPNSLTYDGNNVWVNLTRSVLKIDAENPPVSLTVDDDIDRLGNGAYYQSIVFDGEYIWTVGHNWADFAGGNQYIDRFWAEDPFDDRHPHLTISVSDLLETELEPIFGAGTPARNVHAKGISFDGTYIWATVSRDPGFLFTIPASINTEDTTQIDYGFHPTSINDPYYLTFDGTYMWASSYDSPGGVGTPDHVYIDKIFTGTGLGHTDLNTVVNLDPTAAQAGSINVSGSAEVSSDLTVGADLDVEENAWGGSDETVAVSGTANCPNGYFIKGIILDSNSKISDIICSGLQVSLSVGGRFIDQRRRACALLSQ